MTLSRRHLLMSAAMITGLPFLGEALTPEAFAAGKPMNLEGWTRVDSLSDDFTSFDATRWRKGLWYPESWHRGYFWDDNVTVSDGVLHLAAKVQSVSPGIPLTFGAVESRFDTPGVCSYVEVKARCLDSAASILSAIWLQSSTLTGQDRLKSEPNPEIDVHENVSDRALDWAHHHWPWNGSRHWDDKAPGNGGHYPLDHDLTKDYHLYGVERRDGHVRLYYDRVQYADIDTSQLPERFSALARMSRHVVLSLEGHSRSRYNPAALPASFDIEYVHTYTYAPASAELNGKVWITAPDGRRLAARDGALMLLSPQENQEAQGTSWQLSRQDDLTYVLTAEDGAVLSQADYLGYHDRDLAVVLRADTSTGPDDAGSLSRWHLLKDGDQVKIVSRLSGLPLVPAGDGVVVNGQRNASWTLVPVTAPEPEPTPDPTPAPGTTLPAYVTACQGKPGATILKGDWDGNGTVTYAVRLGSRVVFYNRNTQDAPVYASVSLGRSSDQIQVGDWFGTGKDTLALVRGKRIMLQKQLTSATTVAGTAADLSKARPQ
ncbi:Glycosyl hydrolases family 16 [Actinomyces bovis]|uniref:Glycosyl hydrolases family 16 n=1 Tax=Actinomyces bovis TaxID=1658 RepID=A0ABY1VRS2_9ACTO|nr:family 16 glycosylhydrolase [Actinomyces bovis]SPT54442.1 Glycosyl hydrolases family 16 [Actinomyces bovis]VEG55954.1 Glycosyl hydrolases family 16 [Actinomyces israelii]